MNNTQLVSFVTAFNVITENIRQNIENTREPLVSTVQNSHEYLVEFMFNQREPALAMDRRQFKRKLALEENIVKPLNRKLSVATTGVIPFISVVTIRGFVKNTTAANSIRIYRTFHAEDLVQEKRLEFYQRNRLKFQLTCNILTVDDDYTIIRYDSPDDFEFYLEFTLPVNSIRALARGEKSRILKDTRLSGRPIHGGRCYLAAAYMQTTNVLVLNFKNAFDTTFEIELVLELVL